MAQHETLLAMAQRHVAECEARVAHQTALLAELARDGRNTAGAEAELCWRRRQIEPLPDARPTKR